MVPKEFPRQDRHDVFLVVNMRHFDGLSVDVVREVLVANARKTIAHKTRCDARDVQW